MRMLPAPDPGSMLIRPGLADAPIRPHADVTGSWAATSPSTLLKPMAAGNVYLYSGMLPKGDYPLTGVNVTSSIEDTICESLRSSSDNAIAVIPEGPYVVPYYLPDESV